MLSKTGCVCCMCGMRQPRAAVGERRSPAQFLWLGSRYVACNRGCPGSCTLHLAHGCTRRWQHSQHASPDLVLYSGSLSQHRSCCAMPCATVFLTMWHSPAAAEREAWLGWVQCCLSPLAMQAPQDLCLLPSREGPVPHLPSLLPVPDLGVSQPQGPSVPALALLIDRAGGCWAGAPRPQPFISSVVRLHHITHCHTHAPGSGTAAATCVPAVPTATSLCGHLRGLKPLTPKARLCPCPSHGTQDSGCPMSCPIGPPKPPVPFPRLNHPTAAKHCCGVERLCFQHSMISCVSLALDTTTLVPTATSVWVGVLPLSPSTSDIHPQHGCGRVTGSPSSCSLEEILP